MIRNWQERSGDCRKKPLSQPEKFLVRRWPPIAWRLTANRRVPHGWDELVGIGGDLRRGSRGRIGRRNGYGLGKRHVRIAVLHLLDGSLQLLNPLLKLCHGSRVGVLGTRIGRRIAGDPDDQESEPKGQKECTQSKMTHGSPP